MNSANTYQYNLYENVFTTRFFPYNIAEEYLVHHQQWRTRWITTSAEKKGCIVTRNSVEEVQPEIDRWLHQHPNYWTIETDSQTGEKLYMVHVFTAELWEYEPSGLPIQVCKVYCAEDKK